MGKNLEQGPEKEPGFLRSKAEYVYSKETEEIALRAAQMREFQDAVKQAQGKLKALTAVRELLPKHFPEIKDLPPPKIET